MIDPRQEELTDWQRQRERERERERENETTISRCEQRDRVSRSQFNQHPVQLLVNYEWQLRHRDEHLFVLSSHCRACSKDPFDTVVCARHDHAGEIAHVARTWHREWIFIRSLSDSSRQNYASSKEKHPGQGERERERERERLVAVLLSRSTSSFSPASNILSRAILSLGKRRIPNLREYPSFSLHDTSFIVNEIQNKCEFEEFIFYLILTRI